AQGVTTEVVGNCGHAPAPLVRRSDVPDLVFGYNPTLVPDWSTVDGYLDAWSALGRQSTSRRWWVTSPSAWRFSAAPHGPQRRRSSTGWSSSLARLSRQAPSGSRPDSSTRSGWRARRRS